MYNLLTGYHVGTNRATFLMLPRPHTVQPTLRRTFVQGFREIEGIQDFFLIVARPKDANALCIQTSLETGHIVETAFDVADDSDKAFWEYRTETVTVFEQGGILFKDTPVGSKSINKIFHIITPNSGWEFDPDKGDPGRVSVEENIIRSQHGMQPDDDSAYIENGSLNNYSYFISAPDKLIISATISWNSLVGVWAQGFVTFHRQYKLFLRRRKTISNQETYAKDRERLVITHRDLTVCAKFDDGCPKQIRPDQASGSGPDINDNLDVFIVDDVPLKTGSRGIELSVLQEAMTAGTSSPSRSERGFESFLDTDAFKEMVKRNIPEQVLDQPIDKIEGMSESVRERLKGVTTRDLLHKDLPVLARRTGLEPETIQDVRRKVFGFSQMRNPQRQQTKSGDKD